MECPLLRGKHRLRMSQITGLRSVFGLGSMGVVTPAASFTPNAVNWTDINTTTPAQNPTIGQQITGITSTITLKVNTVDSNLYGWHYGIESTNSTPSSWTYIPFVNGQDGDTVTFTVANNNWLFFMVTITYGVTCVYRTASIINVSDNNTVLDTFQVRLAPRGSSCP